MPMPSSGMVKVELNQITQVNNPSQVILCKAITLCRLKTLAAGKLYAMLKNFLSVN